MNKEETTFARVLIGEKFWSRETGSEWIKTEKKIAANCNGKGSAKWPGNGKVLVRTSK